MVSSRRALRRALLLGSAPVILGACTVVGGGVQPAAPLRPVAPESAPTREDGPVRAGDPGSAADRVTARVVSVALQSIGSPYEWGGNDANGFDCSGLIQFAYARMGIRLPRVSTAQMRAGSPVDPEPDRLRPGDVLGFADDGTGKTSHVGLYIGADEFIHSSSSGVRISSLRNPYWEASLVAARRIVE